jgi:hypothetical protein
VPALMELCAKSKWPIPIWFPEQLEPPPSAHQFRTSVTVSCGTLVTVTGAAAASKKQAKANAAAAWLEQAMPAALAEPEPEPETKSQPVTEAATANGLDAPEPASPEPEPELQSASAVPMAAAAPPLSIGGWLEQVKLAVCTNTLADLGYKDVRSKAIVILVVTS